MNENDAVYVPGMKGVKLLAVLSGVALTLFGLLWLAAPLRLLALGKHASGQVCYVVRTYPGQDGTRITSRKEVRNIADFSRKAIFSYVLRYETETGETREATLNYGQLVRPIHYVGDRIPICYDRRHPERIIAYRSIRTWTFGVFFTIIGLLTTVTQTMIYRAAGKPIIIDPIADLT